MIRTISYACGTVLAVFGIWAFVQNPAFGIFEAGRIHSFIYLAAGLLLLASAAWSKSKTGALQWVGSFFAIVAILGFLGDGETIVWVMHSSVANNIFHTLLAVIFLWAGFFMAKEEPLPLYEPEPPH